MFKVTNINGDVIESTRKPSNVLGSAVHEGLKYYLGGGEVPTPVDEGEAIKFGHQKGRDYLTAFSDGFIEYTATIANRQNLEERFAFCYFGYIKDLDYQKQVKKLVMVEKMLKYRVEVDGKELPIPLKGSADLVYYDHEDRLIIKDHKFTGKYSDEEAIDGAKLLQAAFLYFLTYAELGVPPYSIIFSEFKYTENRDKSRQTRDYEIIYAENPIIFELFYRMYEDVTDMLLGKAVYLPNIYATFDREVAILAYIHRLDVDEIRAEQLKKMKVDNITDFLKRKIETEGKMKRYLETVSQKFISAQTLNYKDMTIPDRIKMKLAEHGMAVDFESKVEGFTVDLYRFEPQVGIKMSRIEGYAKDIEIAVGVSGIRILAPIPNTTLVGFEVPRAERRFPDVAPASQGFSLAFGVDIMGNPYYLDIREAPHLLVAGATGAGKSVFLNALITQLLTQDCEIVLFDPKIVELAQWRNEKKVCAYADEPKQILKHLMGLTKTMDERYKALQKLGKRNIEGTAIKPIFVVLDEFGDLTVGIGNFSEEIRACILKLAQKARAAGIHLILTTQRPSVKIVAGDIKANFPTRVAFRTATEIDSHVILDMPGAEKLLGKGDMLLKTHDDVVRLQGYLVE